jgi:hypothetical protein
LPTRRATKRLLHRAGHADGDVGLAAQQVLAAIAEAELDDQTRIVDLQGGQHRRQHLDPDDLAGGDPHRAGRRTGLGRGGAGERRRRRRHGLDVSGQFASQGGGGQARGRAGEQGHAHLPLQVLDPAADGGLGRAQHASGARQAALAQHGQKGALAFPVGRISQRLAHIF